MYYNIVLVNSVPGYCSIKFCCLLYIEIVLPSKAAIWKLTGNVVLGMGSNWNYLAFTFHCIYLLGNGTDSEIHTELISELPYFEGDWEWCKSLPSWWFSQGEGDWKRSFPSWFNTYYIKAPKVSLCIRQNCLRSYYLVEIQHGGCFPFVKNHGMVCKYPSIQDFQSCAVKHHFSFCPAFGLFQEYHQLSSSSVDVCGLHCWGLGSIDAFTIEAWWNFDKMQIIFKAITGSSGYAFWWERTALHSMETVVWRLPGSLRKYQSRTTFLLRYAIVPYVT